MWLNIENGERIFVARGYEGAILLRASVAALYSPLWSVTAGRFLTGTV